MENFFNQAIENSKQAIRYWWLLTILGFASIIVGILTFVFPVSSYMGISLLLGILILVSGLSMIAVSVMNTHYITSRGWMMVGGLVEVFLGFLLCFNSAFSASILPYFLGFWLLFRSFSMLGMGFDMMSIRHKGGASTVFFGLLALIAAIMILWQPLSVGTQAVIIWVGLCFILAGLSLVNFSWQLKSLHLVHYSHF